MASLHLIAPVKYLALPALRRPSDGAIGQKRQYCEGDEINVRFRDLTDRRQLRSEPCMKRRSIGGRPPEELVRRQRSAPGQAVTDDESAARHELVLPMRSRLLSADSMACSKS